MSLLDVSRLNQHEWNDYLQKSILNEFKRYKKMNSFSIADIVGTESVLLPDMEEESRRCC